MVLLHERLPGKASGIELERRAAKVRTLRDGEPVAMRVYYHRYRALHDAGIAA